jgi:hypothetical protein
LTREIRRINRLTAIVFRGFHYLFSGFFRGFSRLAISRRAVKRIDW